MGRRCLVIGAAGQLGRALGATLRQAQHDVIESVRREPGPGQVRLDLDAPDEAVAVARQLQPDWILIAGAFCNVDAAETSRAECWRVNVEGPRAIAAWAGASGRRVVYYSTDQVFDGTRASYGETDPVHPLNVYAQSKAAGEAAIRAAAPGTHLILRTAWLYGPDPARRNFPLRLADQLGAGRQVPVPADQCGCPTYTEDVARVTQALLAQGRVGTFHAAGPELLDRVALARRICAVFDLDERHVLPMPTTHLRQAAQRPLRVRLDSSALQAMGLGPLRGVAEGLALLRQWQAAWPMAATR